MSTKPIYAAGLDAGSSRTRCVIATLENERLRFLGYGDISSQGWSKGRIADAQAVTTCVRAAVREAEKQARVSVDALVVGLGGSSIDGCNSRGIYEFGRPRPITIDDMEYAVARSEPSSGFARGILVLRQAVPAQP